MSRTIEYKGNFNLVFRRSVVYFYPIYPTPPLGQDMTQGQF